MNELAFDRHGGVAAQGTDVTIAQLCNVDDILRVIIEHSDYRIRDKQRQVVGTWTKGPRANTHYSRSCAVTSVDLAPVAPIP